MDSRALQWTRRRRRDRPWLDAAIRRLRLGGQHPNDRGQVRCNHPYRAGAMETGTRGAWQIVRQVACALATRVALATRAARIGLDAMTSGHQARSRTYFGGGMKAKLLLAGLLLGCAMAAQAQIKV